MNLCTNSARPIRIAALHVPRSEPTVITRLATYLPAENVSRSADGHNVCVGREDFVEHRAMKLALHVLVVLQRDDVLQRQRLACDRVLVKLADVWQDVGQVVHRPIRRACLPFASCR